MFYENLGITTSTLLIQFLCNLIIEIIAFVCHCEIMIFMDIIILIINRIIIRMDDSDDGISSEFTNDQEFFLRSFESNQY